MLQFLCRPECDGCFAPCSLPVRLYDMCLFARDNGIAATWTPFHSIAHEALSFAAEFECIGASHCPVE